MSQEVAEDLLYERDAQPRDCFCKLEGFSSLFGTASIFFVVSEQIHTLALLTEAVNQCTTSAVAPKLC